MLQKLGAPARPVRGRHWFLPNVSPVMRIALLCSHSHDLTLRWVEDALRSLGHEVETAHRPGLPTADAASLGYRLADGWTDAPAAVLALGTAAGLAGLVATRERPAHLVLRLERPGRSGDHEATRVEAALARAADTVLAASPSETEDLVRMGVPRARVHVVPEAVEGASLHPAASTDDPMPVVALDDSAGSVHDLLRGMAAGRPAVVVDAGCLPDLVAEGVCGVVVPSRGDLRSALLALTADGIRRSAMGLAAADRVNACYDAPVVTAALGRTLERVVTAATRAA